VRPDNGVRFELRLQSSNELETEYHLRVASHDSEASGTAQIDATTGKVELGFASGQSLSGPLDQMARALLRSLFRGQQSSGGWPRRVTRWRNESAT
jgi:hypothetical protein